MVLNRYFLRADRWVRPVGQPGGSDRWSRPVGQPEVSARLVGGKPAGGQFGRRITIAILDTLEGCHSGDLLGRQFIHLPRHHVGDRRVVGSVDRPVLHRPTLTPQRDPLLLVVARWPCVADVRQCWPDATLPAAAMATRAVVGVDPAADTQRLRGRRTGGTSNADRHQESNHRSDAPEHVSQRTAATGAALGFGRRFPVILDGQLDLFWWMEAAESRPSATSVPARSSSTSLA